MIVNLNLFTLFLIVSVLCEWFEDIIRLQQVIWDLNLAIYAGKLL